MGSKKVFTNVTIYANNKRSIVKKRHFFRKPRIIKIDFLFFAIFQKSLILSMRIKTLQKSINFKFFYFYPNIIILFKITTNLKI